MPEEVKPSEQSLTRKCPDKYPKASPNTFPRIHNYLSKTNVQLGASYAVGKKSTALYDAGLEAAAKYINASTHNIGKISISIKKPETYIPSPRLLHNPTLPQPLLRPLLPRRLRAPPLLHRPRSQHRLVARPRHPAIPHRKMVDP